MTAELHDPRHDTRLRPCPECDGDGVLHQEYDPDAPPDERDVPECGVCAGDGWLWADLHLPTDPATVGWRFIDHSSFRHSCPRCDPERPEPEADGERRRAVPWSVENEHGPTMMPYVLVALERVRAHSKHDPNGGSMERKWWDDPAWLPVLVEEVGEVARIFCERALRGDPIPAQNVADLFMLRDELTQVSAMSTAWLDAVLAAIDEAGDQEKADDSGWTFDQPVKVTVEVYEQNPAHTRARVWVGRQTGSRGRAGDLVFRTDEWNELVDAGLFATHARLDTRYAEKVETDA